ncbi:hypothetical protein [Pleomorphomonas koreensis]|uniref:hypothetical protein n=1 Tax=Pleomorphomonas koreensis TaxID=257440 RepID=UPI00040530C3|nr:hypothetical protein [Pleomorphomonas koreensis]
MAKDASGIKLTSPQVYLWRMAVFLVIAAFVGLLLSRQLKTAFMANPGLNGLIFSVALVGILLIFRQVIRLFPEVRWVNTYRFGEPGLEVRKQPVLLAPMATLLGDRLGTRAISASAMRSLLESIATRLDEARDISRYMTGLLVFLGLLGTFYGLISTVNSVGATIQGLDVGSGTASVIFEDLKSGLQAPLGGMGTAFSSSLFGLAGSLIVGFLDLQAGQAQNRFYLDLEDWLSTQAELDSAGDVGDSIRNAQNIDDLRGALDRLSKQIQEGGSGGRSSQAMANLAEGIQGLVQHMRAEQQLVRAWAESQGEQQKEIRRLLELLTGAVERSDRS